MPAPIDKAAERQRILEAFQACLSEKPFDRITLRDIAKKADTPHPTVLTYFKNKQDIILSYVGFIADKSIRYSKEWVKNHSVSDFPDKKAYIRALFVTASKLDNESKMLYTGALNVYILSQYEPTVYRSIHEEFKSWLQTLQEMLAKQLGYPSPDPVMAGFILTCLEGICLNTYNGLFDAQTYDGVLDKIAALIAG